MLSVIIPIYNEAENLPVLYEEVVKVLGTLGQPWEVIAINDGSNDGSREILDRLAESDQSLKVIHFKRNFGQTAAMMAGIDFARGDIIISMDGDLQNDPQDIPKFLDSLQQGYDVCSGWRQDRQDSILKRTLPSKIANFLISKISGVRLHDYGCSLKAYKREVIKGVRLYGEMHRFIPIYAAWQGAKVTEIPVSHRPRVHGRSKYGLERTFKVILDLIVVKFLEQYAQKPIYVFGFFGLLNLLVAVLAAAGSLYYKFFGNKSFIQTPLPQLFVLTSITGIMCILMGLLGELIIRTYYESQNKPVYLVAECRNLEKD
jgi:glycosyltransferase involved in cell wall biosynthesis